MAQSLQKKRMYDKNSAGKSNDTPRTVGGKRVSCNGERSTEGTTK